MSISDRTVREVFKELGYPENLGKTYLALLKENPATGYEISSRAGIPRSAVYAVLGRMEIAGLINSMGDSPKRYIPIAPSALIEHLNHLHRDRVGTLEKAFASLDSDEEAFDFWHLHGYRNLLIKMRETILNAQSKIFLSAWDKDIQGVSNELADAEERGVDIVLFSFCKLSHHFGETISYGLAESELRNVWQAKVILVVDHTFTIMGSSHDHDQNRAIWTTNKAITEIATDHIVLDITLAGQRQGFDPSPIVQKVMRRPDIGLGLAELLPSTLEVS